MSPDAPRASGADSDNPVGNGRRAATGALLVVPVLATLAVPLYARSEPRVAGVPFFYWYQFACLLLTAVSLAAAYAVERARPQRPTAEEGPR